MVFVTWMMDNLGSLFVLLQGPLWEISVEADLLRVKSCDIWHLVLNVHQVVRLCHRRTLLTLNCL